MISLSKFKNILLVIFNFIFIFTFIFSLHFATLNPYDKNVSVSLTLGFLAFFIFFIIGNCFLMNSINKKQLITLSCLNLFILLLLQLFFGYYFKISPSWDIGKIYTAASELALGKTNILPEYFTVLYPNNIFVALLWTLFYKICIVLGLNFIGSSIILNIVFIFLSAIVTYFLILKIFNLKVATLSSFLFLLLTPFYTYSPIFYTDTLTMLFLPLSFLLVLYFFKTHKYRYLIFSALSISFGVSIKTNIIIGFIALIIYLFFKTSKLFEFVKISTVLLVSLFIFNGIFSAISQSYINVPLKTAGLPPTHWIMMGLKNVGSYNQEDVNASKAHGPLKSDIKDFNISTIKSRLNNYGVDGYLKFLYKKLEYTWGDGTYFGSELLSRKPTPPRSFHTYVYGKDSKVFKSFAQATHSLLLILVLIGCVISFKNKKSICYLFNICIFGTFLFLILWETKSRYLVCILPLFICSASFSLNYLIDKTSNLKNSLNRNKAGN